MNEKESSLQLAEDAIKHVDKLLQIVARLEVRIEIMQSRLDSIPVRKRPAKRKKEA